MPFVGSRLIDVEYDVFFMSAESNPQLFTNFAHNLGMPKSWEWQDVLGLDVELLDMLPKPAIAVVLLFPCTNSLYASRREQEALMKSQGLHEVDLCRGTYFLHQIPEFGNACGTIACIHALTNSKHHFEVSHLT